MDKIYVWVFLIIIAVVLWMRQKNEVAASVATEPPVMQPVSAEVASGGSHSRKGGKLQDKLSAQWIQTQIARNPAIRLARSYQPNVLLGGRPGIGDPITGVSNRAYPSLNPTPDRRIMNAIHGDKYFNNLATFEDAMSKLSAFSLYT